MFTKIFKKNEEASKIFVRGWKTMEIWSKPPKRFSKNIISKAHGRSGFYEGDVADLIVKEMVYEME